MKYFVWLVLFFGLCSTSNAQFTGELVLEPDGCEKIRKCYTKYPLHYKAPNNVEWEARAGLETDGASIPFWAQQFIGDSYDESFLKAAVVHDHYCDKHVRPWRQTHRAFYSMLRSLKVSEIKSKIMYYAVFIGGPKWIKLVIGDNCGPNCINAYNQLSKLDRVIFEPEKYSSIDDLDEKLKQMENRLLQSNLSLEEIEDIAIAENPDNFYYINESTYPYDPKIGIVR